MRQSSLLPLAALLLAGCPLGEEDPAVTWPTDPPPVSAPSQAAIDDAAARLGDTVESADDARSALELLGILPVYTCGEPRSLFLGKLEGHVEAEVGCAAVTIDATDPAEDVVTIAFGEGCVVAGHDVHGPLVVRLAGGEDHFSLEVDPRALVVDGRTLQALAGYGTCSDETRYWTLADGTLASGRTFHLDLHVAKRAGVPVIGSTTLLVTGTGSLSGSGGTDTVTLTGVEYEMGKLLPRAGTVEIVTAGGRRIVATFSEATLLYGTVTLRIDDHSPVTIPVPA